MTQALPRNIQVVNASQGNTGRLMLLSRISVKYPATRHRQRALNHKTREQMDMPADGVGPPPLINTNAVNAAAPQLIHKIA